jgi:CHAD domain-containing protein
MKIKEETKYLDKEWKEMNTRLKAFLETGSQEELHKFRVQIKKLKAMLSLLEGTSKHSHLLKNFKPVKKIFKYAGQIRDAYVNLQLSEKYHIKNESFEAGQQKIIDKGTTHFRHKGKKYLKNIKHTYKQLKKKLPKVHDGSVTEFYKEQLNQIAAGMAISSFTEDMHTNRKLIKILVYNHKLADKAINGSAHFNIQYLDKLQEAIGKWHDNVVAVELFSSPEVDDKPVVTKINRKNAGVKRNIVSLASDFLYKATNTEPAVN